VIPFRYTVGIRDNTDCYFIICLNLSIHSYEYINLWMVLLMLSSAMTAVQLPTKRYLSVSIGIPINYADGPFIFSCAIINIEPNNK